MRIGADEKARRRPETTLLTDFTKRYNLSRAIRSEVLGKEVARHVERVLRQSVGGEGHRSLKCQPFSR